METLRAPLDLLEVRAGLTHDWLAVDAVDEVESTNAVLIEWDDAPHGTVLVAEHQTAGRGRLDRVWTSPPSAGLTFSIVLRPITPPATWTWLPLMAGLAAAEGYGRVKWPNDVMIEGRKAGGILSQVNGPAVVLGVGLNVTTAPDELPVPDATSLVIEGFTGDRAMVLTGILNELSEWFERWTDAGGDAVACGLWAAYVANCATLGLEVRVTSVDGGSVTEGIATGIDPDGRLILVRDDEEILLGAGDVEHVRPARPESNPAREDDQVQDPDAGPAMAEVVDPDVRADSEAPYGSGATKVDPR